MAKIVDTLVLLSPGEKYQEIHLFEPLKTIFGIPVLMVASEDDKYSASSVEQGKTMCQTRCYAVITKTGGHGTDMIKSPKGNELKKKIIDFLIKPYAKFN